MLCFSAMAKECNIFSFELHSKTFTDGDVSNQRFVIFPRTGDLHTCLSPKQQNQTTIAFGVIYLFPSRLKDYIIGLIICESK